MVLDKITSDARHISGFAELPVTAQISLLYNEIEEARRLSIPLASICKALNDAGSKVELRYLREALSVVRRRLSKPGESNVAKVTTARHTAAATVAPAKDKADKTPTEQNQTPREAREKHAESYMNPANMNPLLRQLNKGDK